MLLFCFFQLNESKFVSLCFLSMLQENTFVVMATIKHILD